MRFGIVFLTPDDIGYARAAGPDKAEPRSRQNVVLEMGMLLAAMGRPRVAILKKGHVEVPSDAAGIIYLGFNDHVKETVPKLVDRLRKAGGRHRRRRDHEGLRVNRRTRGVQQVSTPGVLR